MRFVNFRKMAAGVLTGAMAMAMAACGSSAKPTTAPTQDTTKATSAATTEATTAATTEATTAASEAVSADVQAIIDRGVLRVGVKNAVIGFGYQDPITNEYSGMEIDLANKLAEQLGVDVEFTTVTAATRTELLDSGDIDCVLATFTITEERKKSWDFTTPYYTDHVTVLVEDKSGITSLADLKDKLVGVSSGSTSARALTSAMIDAEVLTGEGFDKETFDPATWTDGVSFQQFDDYPSISTALAAGQIDAFCVDKSILAVYKTEGRSYIADEFAPQDYGIATKKDSGFSAYCEEFIQAGLDDGTVAGLIESYNLN